MHTRGCERSVIVCTQTYVQHLLAANGEEVADTILTQGGHFYVCGDVTMAAQVCETLEQVLAQHGQLTAQQAHEYIIRMKVTATYT